jgi:hypothetical protein
MSLVKWRDGCNVQRCNYSGEEGEWMMVLDRGRLPMPIGASWMMHYNAPITLLNELGSA